METSEGDADVFRPVLCESIRVELLAVDLHGGGVVNHDIDTFLR